MFDTYYTDKIEYMTFFEAMIEEQRDMEDYVNECITLTDPNKKIFNEFQVFNEGKAGDKVKALFNRFRSFFSKIWQKFLEKLRAWVSNNKEYLETYKDIIIGKKVKLNNIKMPDHFQEGWPRIEKIISSVTSFATPLGAKEFEEIYENSNTNSGEGSTAEKKTESITKYKSAQYEKIFKDIGVDVSKVPIKDDEDLATVSSNLTSFLKGDENEFTADELESNMKVMFNKIYSYNETYDGLKKIQDTFQAAMTKSEQAYDKAFGDLKDLINKNAAAQKANKDNPSADNTKAAGEATKKLDDELTKIDKEKKETEDKLKKSNNQNDNPSSTPSSGRNLSTAERLKNAQRNINANKNSSTKNDGYIYTSGSYINESDVKTTGTSSSASAASTNDNGSIVKGGGGNVSTAGASQSAKAQATSMKSKNDTVKSATGDVKADASAMGAGHAADLYHANNNIDAAKLNEFQTHATNLINAYSSCRATVFGATLNAIQATRDDYMTVIRMHVQSYVGTVNDTGDNTSTTTV